MNEGCGSSQIDLTYEIEPKIIQKEIELECEQKRASWIESKALRWMGCKTFMGKKCFEWRWAYPCLV